MGSEDGQSTTKETPSNDIELPTNGILRSNSINAKSGTGQDALVDSTTAAMSVNHNKPDKLFASSKTSLQESIVSASESIKESEPFAAMNLHHHLVQMLCQGSYLF